MKEYEDFLEVESHLKKVILFTEKNKTAPIYKALAIQYHKRLYFGEVSENDDNNPILDEFEIEEFPQLFILYKNDDGSCCAREMFEGDMLWQPMTEWLDEFAESEE